MHIQIDGVQLERVHENKMREFIIDEKISWKSNIYTQNIVHIEG